jgi:tRNA dimethylallyltransferase
MAMQIADALPVEIVSCDSMAVYRGLDLAAAKPSRQDRARVRHHLIDVADPSEDLTAVRYRELARAAIGDIASRGRIPLLVGGSGLWFRAVVDGLRFAPTDPSVRATLERQDPCELYERLLAADPDAAARIDPRNVRRVVRALEIHAISGLRAGELRGQWGQRAPVLAAGLTWDRSELFIRAERRIDEMLAAGLVEEVRAARASGLSRTAAQAVGVKEVFPLLDGVTGLDETRALILRRTKAFIRRQLSWFGADPRVDWTNASLLGWTGAAQKILERFA